MTNTHRFSRKALTLAAIAGLGLLFADVAPAAAHDGGHDRGPSRGDRDFRRDRDDRDRDEYERERDKREAEREREWDKREAEREREWEKRRAELEREREKRWRERDRDDDCDDDDFHHSRYGRYEHPRVRVRTLPRRGQDLDRDGIPNSRDRDIDGDGVPNRRDRYPYERRRR